jgi:hypothetical protein
MSKYIIFKPYHITQVKSAVKDCMLTTKWGTWKNYVEHKDNREDFEFIRIMDSLGHQRWVLPIEVMNNPKFSKLKEICDGITGIKIEELTEADFPIYELDKLTSYE